MTRTRFVLPLLVPLAACGGGDRPGRAASGDATPLPPVQAVAYVDSARPVEEDLARFREGLEVATELRGGAGSREALVRGFTTAVESSDTAAVIRMMVSRPEFAYLYYPHSPLTSPPQEMSPQLAWFFMLQNSQKGITRVFRRLGGSPLGYLDHACDREPLVQGPNRVWEHCRVRRVTADGDTIRQALFGGILERDGHFKFLSYTNEY